MPMKLFLYLVALLTGVAGSQSVEAAQPSARPQACASAIVGAMLLQQATEARAAVRAIPVSMPALPLVFAGHNYTLAPTTVRLKVDRARE